MKRYRLIKEYPGSSEIGAIAMVMTENSNYYKIVLNNVTVALYQSRRYFNNPEFWEEVVEKEYEILTFKGRGQFIYKIGEEIAPGEMYPEKIKITEDILNKNHHFNLKIHSIKRLSDGEVFTIGDEVIHTNNVTNKIGIIENFHIMSNGIWFKTNNYDAPLCYIKNKTKTPLFTTEDGIDIFEGDKFYNVDNFRIQEYQVTNNKYNLKFLNNVEKQFSTKEKAEEYIFRTKPVLSYNDIMSVTSGTYIMWVKMTELIKSRL